MRLSRGWMLVLLACVGPACAGVRVVPQDSGVTVRLRGISAVDAQVGWASGREGTVLRTTDGGAHWANVSVPDAKALDFRDVEGFDAETAVVLGIGPGEASRVYRTADGGRTWQLVLQNRDARAFFDCMAFDGPRGWMLGDPVDGRYEVRQTDDGGRTWSLWPQGPAALADEAAFAASGTCIAVGPRRQPMIAGGGGAARVQAFDGQAWTAWDARMPHRVPAAGIFSIARGGPGALLVGGDFEHPEQGSAAWIDFGAHATTVRALPAPRGYRSGAACVSRHACVAVGPSGVDVLAFPAGKRPAWSAVSDTGFDAVDVAGQAGWASGDGGRIARIEAAD